MGANERVRVAMIGCGERGNQLTNCMPEGCEIVAAVDAYFPRAEKLAARLPGQVQAPALVNAARHFDRVVQVGTQQRTMEMDRFACELVRDGGIGEVKIVECVNYGSSKPYPKDGLPEQPVPKGLDWDVWMDDRGPVELWPNGVAEAGTLRIDFRYANGVEVRLRFPNKLPYRGPRLGGVFIGSKCKMEINRNKFVTNPVDFVKDAPPAELAANWEGDGHVARGHIEDWLDAIKTRRRPNADVEID